MGGNIILEVTKSKLDLKLRETTLKLIRKSEIRVCHSQRIVNGYRSKKSESNIRKSWHRQKRKLNKK